MGGPGITLGTTTTDYTSDTPDFLASRHGVDTAKTISLDGDALIAAFPDGNVPAGVVVGLVTATQRYARYDDAAVDGRETARYVTLSPCKAVAGKPCITAGLWHCQIIEDRLPAGSGINAAAKADLKLIHFL
jgi:hypothetical protein